MMVNRRCLLLSAMSLTLVGCNAGKKQAPTIQGIKSETTGFTVGPSVSANELFVFFDPGCPHCAMLWRETKPLQASARFTWIPVAFSGPIGRSHGASILSAKNPAGMMDIHTADVLARKHGVEIKGLDSKVLAAIDANTRMLDSFETKGIPFSVGQHGTTKTVVWRDGSMSAKDLVNHFGWI